MILEQIKETQRQLTLTTSKQRKYELHRHLTKLWKRYNREKRKRGKKTRCLKNTTMFI